MREKWEVKLKTEDLDRLNLLAENLTSVNISCITLIELIHAARLGLWAEEHGIELLRMIVDEYDNDWRVMAEKALAAMPEGPKN